MKFIAPQNRHFQSWVEVGGDSQEIPPSWQHEATQLWEAAGDRYLEQHVSFMRVNDLIDGSRTHVFELRNTSGLRAYAAVEAGVTTFAWQLGRFTVYRTTMRRLRVVRGAVFANDVDPEEAGAATADLLLLLRSRFRGWPLYLEAARMTPAFGAFLDDARLRSDFVISRRRPPQAHYCLDLPESMAEYLQLIGPKRRQDIRRLTRRLDESCRADIKLVTYWSPADIDPFLMAALPIARKTYQYSLYSAGLAADQRISSRSHLLADKGWWRGHLLYVEDMPVAFLLGYQIDDTYFGLEMGHDPAWAHLAVGTCALIRLIESMFTWNDRPKRFDFGHGASDYKRRLSSLAWEEDFCDFISKTPVMIALHLSFKAWSALSRSLLKVLKYYGIRTRRQRFRSACSSDRVNSEQSAGSSTYDT